MLAHSHNTLSTCVQSCMSQVLDAMRPDSMEHHRRYIVHTLIHEHHVLMTALAHLCIHAAAAAAAATGSLVACPSAVLLLQQAV